MLALVLPYPSRFRLALKASALGRPLIPLFRAIKPARPIAAMLSLAPKTVPEPDNSAPPAPAAEPKGRVAILAGCAQSVLDPGINAAARRLLSRTGIEIAVPEGEGCCGALVHHMGRENDSLAAARRNVDAWTKLIDNGGLDAILITTSGCGTTINDYGHMLRLDPDYAGKAARVSALAKDITEYLGTIELPEPAEIGKLTIAYHAACSLQHGQKVTVQPKALLRGAGFAVKEPAEGHLCCGSAGTYNIMQPEISAKLRDRKVKNIERTRPQAIAAGNIGCITQIGSGTGIPVVHTVELLDWAYGGPKPEQLDGIEPQPREMAVEAAE